MRTKTLILTAALSLAGIASSMAQVFSQNIVGYVNVTVPKNPVGAVTFSLMNNPLSAATNTLQGVLPSVPDFTIVYKFGGGTYQGPYTYLGGSWDSPNITLAPGEGFFLGLDNSVVTGPTTITFVGEVLTGASNSPNTTLSIPKGVSLLGTRIPQGGNLVSELGFPVADFDLVYTWNRGGWAFAGPFTALGGAFDTPVIVQPGDAFFLIPDSATPVRSWTRNFNP